MEPTTLRTELITIPIRAWGDSTLPRGLSSLQTPPGQASSPLAKTKVELDRKNVRDNKKTKITIFFIIFNLEQLHFNYSILIKKKKGVDVFDATPFKDVL